MNFIRFGKKEHCNFHISSKIKQELDIFAFPDGSNISRTYSARVPLFLLIDKVGTMVGARENFCILTFLDILNPPFSPLSVRFKYSQCLLPELDLS